jgi:hypothetical protein
MTLTRAIKTVVFQFVLLFGIALLGFDIAVAAQSVDSASQANAATPAKSVSLGDMARQQRANAHPKAKRVVTNDDIAPSEAALSQSSSDKTADASADDKEKKASAEDKEKERTKPYIEAVDAQKKRIAEAQKKIQDLNTERRQRASAQYSDMGVLLRDPQKWNNDEKAVQDELAQKQKDIDDANAKLEEARENARKNGVKLPE